MFQCNFTNVHIPQMNTRLCYSFFFHIHLWRALLCIANQFWLFLHYFIMPPSRTHTKMFPHANDSPLDCLALHLILSSTTCHSCLNPLGFCLWIYVLHSWIDCHRCPSTFKLWSWSRMHWSRAETGLVPFACHHGSEVGFGTLKKTDENLMIYLCQGR